MNIPDSVQKFRSHYIKTYVGRFYSGYVHYGLEFFAVTAAVLLALNHLQNVKAIELLTVPAMLIVGNFVEYLAHRFLLHENKSYTKHFYREHTVLHHHYFTDVAIDMDNIIDLHRILFPPIGTFFFIFFVGVPIACIAYFFININVAILTFISVVLFFLIYETVHLICHLPNASRLFRIKFLKKLKEHHRVHHNLQLMSRYNFNISFPLADFLLRTIAPAEIKPEI